MEIDHRAANRVNHRRSPPQARKASSRSRLPEEEPPPSGPAKTVCASARPSDGHASPRFGPRSRRMRRRALDRAVGLMARHTHWAAEQIVELGKTASSEAVRLSASRAVLSDMIAVSKFGGPRRSHDRN